MNSKRAVVKQKHILLHCIEHLRVQHPRNYRMDEYLEETSADTILHVTQHVSMLALQTLPYQQSKVINTSY